MMQFVSTRGEIEPVGFEEAVLQGFAADGGLFVPKEIPVLDSAALERLATLAFPQLALELISLYVEPLVIPRDDLKRLVEDSFGNFDRPTVVELVPIRSQPDTQILELFHGPTLSFKDMAMGLLMNVVDYFLQRRGERLNIILATTGDTGPAAAWAAAGKGHIDCWPLYPRGMISEEQERQMTTLNADNVHPVGVENCPDGGDDLDIVVAELFADADLKRSLGLSSVNSINWCRVMVQAVHYFYAYFRTVDRVGASIVFSVPSGAFGNLFGGFLARSMGLPVSRFVCANNTNDALHSAFSTGVFARRDLIQTPSSAIDIVAPYNFWRFLYFASGRDPQRIRQWMEDFSEKREARLDAQTLAFIQDGFLSASISDQVTTDTIRAVYQSDTAYLLDPHTAVAVAAVDTVADQLPTDARIVCLGTAHPAKFLDVISRTLGCGDDLPTAARHQSIEDARDACQHLRLCRLDTLKSNLVDAMNSQAMRRQA